MYCTLHEVHEVGETPQALILGEVKGMYIRDDAVTEQDGRWAIDVATLNPLARLGGSDYAGLSAAFTIPRPK